MTNREAHLEKLQRTPHWEQLQSVWKTRVRKQNDTEKWEREAEINKTKLDKSKCQVLPSPRKQMYKQNMKQGAANVWHKTISAGKSQVGVTLPQHGRQARARGTALQEHHTKDKGGQLQAERGPVAVWDVLAGGIPCQTRVAFQAQPKASAVFSSEMETPEAAEREEDDKRQQRFPEPGEPFFCPWGTAR